MEKFNIYTISSSVNPMGYMEAPAADYDCGKGGADMHKLKV